MVKEEGVSFPSEDLDNGSTGNTLFVTMGCAILHGNLDEVMRTVTPGNDKVGARGFEDGCG